MKDDCGIYIRPRQPTTIAVNKSSQGGRMTKTGYAQHCNKSANYLHRAISVGGYLLVVARRSAVRSALVVLALPPCPYLTSCRPFRLITGDE